MDSSRLALHESKHQYQQLSDRFKNLQTDFNELDQRRTELERQMRQTKNLLNKHQETEHELNKKLELLTKDKNDLLNQINSYRQNLVVVENTCDHLVKSSSCLEKDKHTLFQHLKLAEKERQYNEDIMSKNNADRCEMEIVLKRLEDENINSKKQVQYLKVCSLIFEFKKKKNYE